MDYLQELDIPYHPACSRPSSNMQVFRVVLMHLAATYRGAGDAIKVQEVETWIADLEEDDLQFTKPISENETPN